MTVIRPNSISGITSLTAHRGSIDFYAHDGSAATFNNINSNVTSGVSTFASLNIMGDLDVGGALTYEDVTNVDSIGVVTARNGIDVTGGTVNITTGSNSASPAGSGDNLVIKDSNGCGLSILSGNGNSQNIYLGSVSDNDAVRLEGFYNSGSPYFKIYTAGSERLRITSDGIIRQLGSNGALGQGDSVAKLTQYTADGTTPGGAGDVTTLETISATSNGSDYRFVITKREGSGGGSCYINLGGNSDGSISFGTNTSGSGTERLRITSSGNVIIGDSASDLSGTHTFMACGEYHAFQRDGNTGTYLSIGLGAANGTVDIEADARSGNYPDLRFITTNTERLRITSDGKIGIGHHTSTQISHELTIRPANDGGIMIGRPGDTVAPINRALTITTTTTGSEAYHTTYHTYNCNSIFATYEAGGTGGNFIFKTGTSSGQEVEKLRITSGGDVVIGTTAAARSPLHIHKDSADCYLHVTNSTTGTGVDDGFTIHQSGVETLLNNRESGNMRLYTNGGEKVRVTSSGRLIAGKSMSQALSSIDYCDVDFHCTGPLSVGSNSNVNQAEMQRVGRRVINLYNTSYSGSGGSYLHLETSLWGGGSPHGNSEFIMGGFHIHGYRYSSSGICEEIIYFHQWNGSLANYSRHQYGNWNAGSSCYVGSNGNVYIRLPNSNYYGFAIDFIQHPWYSVRDCTILNATFSNSSSL